MSDLARLLSGLPWQPMPRLSNRHMCKHMIGQDGYTLLVTGGKRARDWLTGGQQARDWLIDGQQARDWLIGGQLACDWSGRVKLV